MMNKQTIVEEMTAKVNEVIDARDAVYEHLQEIEEAVASGQEQVAQLEQELQNQQDALSMAQNLGEAKLIKQKIDSLAEDIELQKTVNTSKSNGTASGLADKADAFFKAHKSASFLYGTVDNYFLANTCLANFQEDKGILAGFANTLNNSFKGVKQVLLDTKLCEVNGNYVSFRGNYLGQRDLKTELEVFEAQCKLRQFVYESYRAGKLSKAWF